MELKNKNIISVSKFAEQKINELIEESANKPIGIRIKLESGGCSGSKYKFSYVYEKNPLDEEINLSRYNLYIDPASVIKIIGSELDYEETKLKKGFVFNNPNEKGRCGCGESVAV